jgi:thiol-disulfide isomerase/thioredoxin
MLPRFKTVAAAALFVAVTIAASIAATRGIGIQRPSGRPFAAPELAGIGNWINSEPLTMRQLRGKVVLVDFWTYSCVNCVDTLPYIKRWDQKYKDQGLTVIGVHTPEYAFERDTQNVKTAVARLGIRFPVAQDNQYATWDAFNNEYWPALYLIDKTGQVVYSHFGEGDYAETEAAIRNQLAKTVKD